MRIITGDDTGLIKSISIEEKKLLATFGEQKESGAIEYLSFLNADETLLSSCTKNKTVLLYELDAEKKGEFKTTLFEYDIAEKKGPIVGFNYLGEDLKKIIITNSDGFSSQLTVDFQEGTLGNYEDLFTVPFKNINRVKLSSTNKGHLFFLSKDTNPQIWDINSLKNAWKARNVKNDFLDLKVPINDLDVCFPSDGKTCIVATAYHKIRIYDVLKNNSQPIIDFELPFEKSPLNNVILSHCGNYLFASNNLGSTFQLDLRKDFQLVGKLKGASGTIKSMSLHSTSNYIATTCLDRFLRVYDLNDNNKLIYRIFMKHRLNCLIFSSEELNTDMLGSEEEELFLKKDYNVKIDDEKKELLKRKRKHSIKLPYFDPSSVPIPVVSEKKVPLKKKAQKNINEEVDGPDSEEDEGEGRLNEDEGSLNESAGESDFGLDDDEDLDELGDEGQPERRKNKGKKKKTPGEKKKIQFPKKNSNKKGRKNEKTLGGRKKPKLGRN